MAGEIIFLITVLITNIIQGITGFAGTVLAMPFSVMSVGFNTAKPILNVLGILAGIYVVALSYKHIDKKEFLKCTAVMLFGTAVGIYIKSFFTANEQLLYKILGATVIAVGLSGIYKMFIKKDSADRPHSEAVSYLLLVSSGIVHGMFVCGGPLLVAYLTRKIKSKQAFRATVSAIWIVLNGVIMADDIKAGYFNVRVCVLLLVCAAVLFAAMAIGNVLYKKMSRDLFMKITYVLLVISGTSLFIK